LFGVICKEVEAKKDQVCAQLIVRKADDEKRLRPSTLRDLRVIRGKT
jgi:hypothetical protein